MADDGFVPLDTFVPVKVAPKDDGRSVIGGAVADTLGMTGRPESFRFGGAKPHERGPEDVWLNPQGGLEHVASAAINTLPIMKAGGLAARSGLPAVAGRIAASGALGGTRAAHQGGDTGDVLWGAVLDGLLAAGTEGLGTVIGGAPGVAAYAAKKLGKEVPTRFKTLEDLKELGSPARAFEWAKGAPEEALKLVAQRLPKGKWVNAPAISPTPISVDEAVKELPKLRGLKYQQALEELKNEMNRLDAQRLTGPRPHAGSVFKKGVAKELYESPNLPAARGAETEIARRAAKGPATGALRSTADAAVMTEPELSAAAALKALGYAPGFGSVASRIMPNL